MTQMSSEQLLWQAYRDAFWQFKRDAARLSAGNQKSKYDPSEAEKTLARVEHARMAYNDSRDALAASRMPAELARLFWTIPTASGRDDARVKSIAELLWELKGKPQGSADDDWYRAERVARYAGAELVGAR